MANDVWLIGHGGVTDDDKTEITLPAGVSVCFYTGDGMDLPLDLVPIAVQSDIKGVVPVDRLEKQDERPRMMSNLSLAPYNRSERQRVKDAARSPNAVRHYYLGEGEFAAYSNRRRLRLCTTPAKCNDEARDGTALGDRHTCDGLFGVWRTTFGIDTGPVSIHIVSCRRRMDSRNPRMQNHLHRRVADQDAWDGGRYRERKVLRAREVLVRAALDPEGEYYRLKQTPKIAGQLTTSCHGLCLWRDIMDKLDSQDMTGADQEAFQKRYRSTVRPAIRKRVLYALPMSARGVLGVSPVAVTGHPPLEFTECLYDHAWWDLFVAWLGEDVTRRSTKSLLASWITITTIKDICKAVGKADNMLKEKELKNLVIRAARAIPDGIADAESFRQETRMVNDALAEYWTAVKAGIGAGRKSAIGNTPLDDYVPDLLKKLRQQINQVIKPSYDEFLANHKRVPHVPISPSSS